MKIVVLSRNEALYSTRRIVEACRKRGHEVDVLDTIRFGIHVEQGNPKLFFQDRPIEGYEAVVPRIGSSITFFGTAVVRQFEQMGVYCLNTSLAISISRDKLRAMQMLSRHRNIGFPVTEFVKHRTMVIPAIEAAGGAPVIIKLLEGTQGVGVILADSRKVAEAIIETLQSTRQNVLVQRFVQESRGRDLRAFVVGGKVIAAMRRTAQKGEFRSNVHRGGSVENVTLDPAYEEAAVHAAQILGLNMAGVDMLEGQNGPQLMEVNSSPGLEGIESATGIDVAGAIAEYIEGQVLFPDIDIRQRLTLQSGYGVAEVPIHPQSPLKNITLKDAGLRDKDIMVLSIKRGSVTIPTPKGNCEILPGDRLLCFGKTVTIKTLFPSQKGQGNAPGAS